MKRLNILSVSCVCVSLLSMNAVHAELVGLWRFDADVSPQPDSSGNGHSATPMNDAAWADDAERGGVYSFDGDADHLLVEDTDKLSITGEMTIAAWANFTSFDSWNSIVSKTGDVETNKPAPYDMYTGRLGDGRVTMFLGNGTDSLQNIVSTTASATQEWEHLAVTVSADGTIKHYLNGELNGEGATDTTRLDLDASLLIGSRADGVTNMNGLLDDVAIWNQELSQSEIRSSMAGTFVPEPNGVAITLIAACGLLVARKQRK